MTLSVSKLRGGCSCKIEYMYYDSARAVLGTKRSGKVRIESGVQVCDTCHLDIINMDVRHHSCPKPTPCQRN
jgi:hypothetical protein